MKVQSTIANQSTIPQAQWDEIAKLAAISKIKNAIADLLIIAPELELDSTIEFIHGLVIRELKNRKR